MRVSLAAGFLIALLVAGCGTKSGQVGSSDPAEDVGRPPDLIVTAGEDQLALSPFGYCWSSAGQTVCADGAPPDPLPALTVDVGESLSVEFPLDWNLQGSLFAGEGYCDGSSIVDIALADSPIEALGPAGTYRMEIFGSGEEGDGAWAFELTTTEDQSEPLPFVQVLWYPSERDLEEGASFDAQLGNLTSKPKEVSAVVTVTSADGGSKEFELQGDVDDDCWASMVGLTGPDNLTAQVLEIGSAPYDVMITFNVDEMLVTSPTFTWPDDFPANSNESTRKVVNPAN
jgi:hypothetical protein